METTTVKISKIHSEMLDKIGLKLKRNEKKSLLEDMIEYFNRYPFDPKGAYSTLDDKFFIVAREFSDVKDELREIKKELKKK